jgi:hypothetical protein
MPLGIAQQAHDARSPHTAVARAGIVVSSPTVETQSFFRVTSQGTTAYTQLHGNPEGNARKVWLTIEVIGMVKGDDSDGETCKASVKHPLDGPRSCTSTRQT